MGMKCYLLLIIIPIFSSLYAGTSRSNYWRGDMLVITYNGRTEMFPGWTSEANHYWQNGPSNLPVPNSKSDYTGSSVFDFDFGIKEDDKRLLNLERLVLKQNEEIEDLLTITEALINKIELLEKNLDSIHSNSRTAVWTDLNGKSIIGEFIEYDLATVRIKKFPDHKTYNIPINKLSVESQKLALALDVNSKN